MQKKKLNETIVKRKSITLKVLGTVREIPLHIFDGVCEI
jgi:hypothetical protein